MEPGIDKTQSISTESSSGDANRSVYSWVRTVICGTGDVRLGGFCLKRTLINECWGLFKYGVVGGSSLALHTGLYHVFSRFIWAQGPRTLEYVIALVTASIYNFTLHRIWTFSMNGYSHQMVVRYICVILTSMGMQSGIFYVGVSLMGIYDYYVFAVSVVFAATLQYFGHRFVTFNKRFERCEDASSTVGPEGTASV